MIIRKLKISEIEKVADLHSKNLSNTTSTILGLNYLNKVYQITADENLTFVAISNKKIVGAISATRDLSNLQNKLKKQLFSFSFLLQLSGLLISGRLKSLDLMERLRYESVLAERMERDYIYILTLFVDGKFRRNSLGRRLVLKMNNIKNHKNLKNIFVATLAENKIALKFYTSMGFKPQGRIGKSQLFKKTI